MEYETRGAASTSTLDRAALLTLATTLGHAEFFEELWRALQARFHARYVAVAVAEGGEIARFRTLYSAGAHAASAPLRESRGVVVNVASTLGVVGSPLLSAYGASKAAMIHLTRTLAREWAEYGVRVNALCPGYVETELTARMLANERIRTSILEQTPMGRLASMEELTAPALFLASDEASYITGAALLVDGGFAA